MIIYLKSRFGILCTDEGIMTNNEWDLPRTSFYNTLTNKKNHIYEK